MFQKIVLLLYLCVFSYYKKKLRSHFPPKGNSASRTRNPLVPVPNKSLHPHCPAGQPPPMGAYWNQPSKSGLLSLKCHFAQRIPIKSEPLNISEVKKIQYTAIPPGLATLSNPVFYRASKVSQEVVNSAVMEGNHC